MVRESVSIWVVIATAGRPGIVNDPILALEDLPSGLSLNGIVSAPTLADVGDVPLPHNWRTVLGVRGAAAQRNAALDLIPNNADFVFFFDDDALPRVDYIPVSVEAFRRRSDLVAMTGNVIADGAPKRLEISLSEAKALLKQSVSQIPSMDVVNIIDNHQELYGCNFGVRWSKLSSLRFDSRLPLYSWLEDHDYARRALAYGRLAKVMGSVVVHRGSDSGGRLAHRRYGYSQVSNALYLWQKGSFPLRLMLEQVGRPASKNLVFAIHPSQGAMRRARLTGNFLAFRDFVRHGFVAEPERMLDM